MPESNEPILFDFVTEESIGTQKFFEILGRFFLALEEGALLLVDEFESNMHPLLSRKLINYFQSNAHNSKGAQLIFITHDATLMDLNVLRRDQIWLVDKGSDQASEVFSLYDFKDRPRVRSILSKNYLSGRFGGVPMFGPEFEEADD
jgi:AAA15 family ATPase/GTPase